MDYYSKYLKYKNKYLNLIAGSRRLVPTHANLRDQFLRHEQRETDPPTIVQRETGSNRETVRDPNMQPGEGPNRETVRDPNMQPGEGPNRELVRDPNMEPITGPPNPCGNILSQYREQRINLSLNGINLNDTRIFLKTNNSDPDPDQDWEISHVNNHIPRYRNYFNINDKRIINFDFHNIIDTIDRNSYLVCSSYNTSNDIQLGITETRKVNENVYQTASRGIYEEIGLHIPVEYIQQHNQNFVLIHRKVNGKLSYRWAVHLIIINGDDFFNDRIPNNNVYVSENHNEVNRRRFNYRHDNIEENNIHSVHILLYGTDLDNIMFKFNTINPLIICQNFGVDDDTRQEYIDIDPVLIPTQNLYDLFFSNMEPGEELILN
jgi:hypothetical protein